MAQDKLSFENQVAVVTGGASGLGRAVAELLRRAGARVAVLDVSEQQGRAVADEIGARFVRCDVTDRTSWHEAAQVVIHELGPPTLLHLNAGVMTRPPSAAVDDDPFAWISDGGYRRVMSVNADGVVFGLEAMVPAMVEAGGGKVVVTASTAGITPLPFDPFYSMSKHAVIGLVRSVAPLLSARGIAIKAICPGGVATPLVPKGIAASAASLMAPEAVAEVVLKLLLENPAGEVWVKASATEPEYRVE